MQNLHVDSYRPDASTAALDCDIAIVGGGIVGATLAAALKDTGLRILLIEINTLEQAAARERGYALRPYRGKFLRALGSGTRSFPTSASTGIFTCRMLTIPKL